MNREIFWNIINALLAGGLVFAGAFTSGNITLNSFLAAITAAVIVIITKFKNYWDLEEGEYKTKQIFNFIH